eukprot:CAMPEP_0196756376 /NCGR_PEP_ID=MMETSP1091-20130531/100771_1 /TAXON_ID=302021 /ORGANISM="Rhodomonas sp., Strain CCMP768" /LENGTH=68 /DNA_ID=CAMNT_0042104977 /DNA_START=17 /DNA_END=220 /DNA_ORIENTATION=-
MRGKPCAASARKGSTHEERSQCHHALQPLISSVVKARHRPARARAAHHMLPNATRGNTPAVSADLKRL